MKKLSPYIFAFTMVAAGAVAATDMLVPASPEPILIEVAASELEDCRRTLAEVSQMPAVSDQGGSILFQHEGNLPSVQCVAY